MIKINTEIPRSCADCFALVGDELHGYVCKLTRQTMKDAEFVLLSKKGTLKMNKCPLQEENMKYNIKHINTCNVCNNLEKGDSLYVCRYDDVGYCFDEIKNIQYCPKCGCHLLTDEEKDKRTKQQ